MEDRGDFKKERGRSESTKQHYLLLLLLLECLLKLATLCLNCIYVYVCVMSAC